MDANATRAALAEARTRYAVLRERGRALRARRHTAGPGRRGRPPGEVPAVLAREFAHLRADFAALTHQGRAAVFDADARTLFRERPRRSSSSCALEDGRQEGGGGRVVVGGQDRLVHGELPSGRGSSLGI